MWGPGPHTSWPAAPVCSLGVHGQGQGLLRWLRLCGCQCARDPRKPQATLACVSQLPLPTPMDHAAVRVGVQALSSLPGPVVRASWPSVPLAPTLLQEPRSDHSVLFQVGPSWASLRPTTVKVSLELSGLFGFSNLQRHHQASSPTCSSEQALPGVCPLSTREG